MGKGGPCGMEYMSLGCGLMPDPRDTIGGPVQRERKGR